MVKSNIQFSDNYKKSKNIQDIIYKEFIQKNFKIINFDIDSEFEKCNKDCPIQIDHMGEKIPYARWILYNKISRPDLIVNYNKPIFIETKYKNKKYLWINKRDYLDYIKWETITSIPVFVIMYVSQENIFYVHKLDLNPNKLKSLTTSHDKNKVFDVQDSCMRYEDVDSMTNFFKTL
ncbi:MAG TPA: hypothetical protein PKY52_05660 [Methanofastidiosum sp.]|nr:MAG: hypothetical protein BWX72_01602 [Firmicutes bacterium ADurb.Bin080]HOE93296.1 hypothetical protein [Methanofastidiosum sp.]HPL72655.1 hypothetical protein [Candidatus Pacearchaeota archaeon]HOR88343.1 hypothetical protein [Methanofastidiosum sp.]HOT84565.1 hypothetical protein [Methanofastidiosum sp.]